MRRMAAAAFALAFGIATAGESPYQGPKATEQYLFCTASRQAHELSDETVVPAVIYYSAAFTVKPDETNKVSAAFLAYLKEKYKFEPEPGAPMPVGCTGVASLDQAKSLRDTRLAQSKKGAPNTVDTGWTYGASTSAAAPH